MINLSDLVADGMRLCPGKAGCDDGSGEGEGS